MRFIHTFTSTEYCYPEHVTPYLLVCNFGTSGEYLLNHEPIKADDRLFYFANAGDEIEIRFAGGKKREMLLMLFDGRLVEQAADAVFRSPEFVLDHPNGEGGKAVVIPGIPFGYTPAFRDLVDEFRSFSVGTGPIAEAVSEWVLAGFFRLYGGAKVEMCRLATAKASTRQELYKRLVVAKAYMQEHVGMPLTVGQIAKEACLNQYYFLELFRKAFGVTPHQYLRRKKLEYAEALLREGYCVMEVCQRVGFESLGSFAHLFKKTFGCTPGGYRQSGGKRS